MAIVKLPLLTSFCGGLVIFAGCAYVGFGGAESVTLRWRRPMSFNSLRGQNAEPLRKTLLALQALGFSQISEDSLPALQKNIGYLGKLRDKTGPEIQPIVDLQMARDHAEMARLTLQSGNAVVAAGHREAAAAVVSRLGWKDVSDNALATLTTGQVFWWKAAKK